MLNVAVIMGRLTADPELRHTPNGIAVTSFTVAVDRPYSKSREDRQTDFIEVVAWRTNAEFITKYFSKGSMIVVEGSIQTRTYTDNSNNKRKAWEIIANRAHFGESKGASSQGGGSYAAQSPMAELNAQAPAFESGSVDDFTTLPDDDDLPF